jgi:hypothetical protein
MSADELKILGKKLAEIDREAKQTDQAVDALKRATVQSNAEVKQLKERADRVQRRLAEAS